MVMTKEKQLQLFFFILLVFYFRKAMVSRDTEKEFDERDALQHYADNVEAK